jgi:hypothetical protein
VPSANSPQKPDIPKFFWAFVGRFGRFEKINFFRIFFSQLFFSNFFLKFFLKFVEKKKSEKNIFSNLPNWPRNVQKNFGMSGFGGEFALGTHFGSVHISNVS